ncbi:MAG: ribonuclease III [Ruminococcaceae bacterium]|nr:ribonuclease III [Oscillospiraceae bacterium]
MKDLEAAIGYKFKNITHLQRALTHSSYANEHWHDSLKSNERLEFLGDSVLGMVVAEFLFRSFPDRLEGDLTRMRADMVCEKSLAQIAQQLDLGKYLLLGHGEEQNGGRQRPSILSDAVEAVLAACFMDGGMAAAESFIRKFVLCKVPETKLHNEDYKTALQELVQQKKDQQISYQPVEEFGPDHDKTFVVEVKLNGAVVGKGKGSSKKRAEQDAARLAIEKLFPNK